MKKNLNWNEMKNVFIDWGEVGTCKSVHLKFKSEEGRLRVEE